MALRSWRLTFALYYIGETLKIINNSESHVKTQLNINKIEYLNQASDDFKFLILSLFILLLLLNKC